MELDWKTISGHILWLWGFHRSCERLTKKGQYVPPAHLIYVGDNLADVTVHEQKQMCLQLICDKLKVASLKLNPKNCRLV